VSPDTGTKTLDTRCSRLELPVIVGRRVSEVVTASAVVVVMTAAFGAYGPAVQGQSQNSEQQLAQLRQQVTALERRVVELEKVKGGVAVGPGKASDSHKSEQPPPVASAATSVTAPFTVVDRLGQVIMRVDDVSQDLARGAYFYGRGGKIGSHVGANDDGGRVYVSRGDLPQVGMGSGADGNSLLVRGDGGALSLTKADAITFFGRSNAAIALFGSKDSTKGYLELNDPTGNIMVEAGSLVSHKGYVLANPYKASTALTGDPSVIRGGGR